MRVIDKRRLNEFGAQWPLALEYLAAWYEHVRKAHWATPADIKRDYATASILQDNRVVFNIKGNDFRLVVRINYPAEAIYICFIGTHKQYDRINANTVRWSKK